MKNLKDFEEISEINRTIPQPTTDASERYPEFNDLVEDLAKMVAKEINAKAKKIESEMPYKSQHVLEELIKKLETMV